jgi:hypothetical protein
VQRYDWKIKGATAAGVGGPRRARLMRRERGQPSATALMVGIADRRCTLRRTANLSKRQICRTSFRIECRATKAMAGAASFRAGNGTERGYHKMRLIVARRSALVSAVLVLMLVCVSHTASAQQEVMATMGNQQVRTADLKRLIDALTPDVCKRLATDLGALDRLVREELVRQTILGEARQQAGTKPDVQLLMERARAGAAAGLREQSSRARSPVIRRMRSALLRGQQGSVTVPAEYQLSQIFIHRRESARHRGAAQNKATEIAARMQKSRPISARSRRRARSTRTARRRAAIWGGCRITS